MKNLHHFFGDLYTVFDFELDAIKDLGNCNKSVDWDKVLLVVTMVLVTSAIKFGQPRPDRQPPSFCCTSRASRTCS